MEEIAARAGVGVGTVYRRFASKDALTDELLHLTLEDVLSAAELALARTDGYGLEELLRAFGQSFADHARNASLLLQRPADATATRRIRAAMLIHRCTHCGRLRMNRTAADDNVLLLVQLAALPLATPHFPYLSSAMSPGHGVQTADRPD